MPDLFKNLLHPLCAAGLMSLALFVYQDLSGSFLPGGLNLIFVLAVKIGVSERSYTSDIFCYFDKQLIASGTGKPQDPEIPGPCLLEADYHQEEPDNLKIHVEKVFSPNSLIGGLTLILI